MGADAGDGVGAEGETQRSIGGGKRGGDGDSGFAGVALLAVVHAVGEGAGAADSFGIGGELGHVFQSSAGEIGAEGAGFDDENFDIEGLHLEGESFRKTFEGKLGGRVGAEAGKGELTADAADVDDGAGALGAEGRQEGAGDGDGAEEVGFKLGAEFGFGGFFDSADGAIAGVVDEHVDATEVSESGAGGGGDLSRIGDIESERQDTIGGEGRDGGETGGVARGDDDAVALFDGICGEGLAEAGGCARDEPDL